MASMFNAFNPLTFDAFIESKMVHEPWTMNLEYLCYNGFKVATIQWNSVNFYKIKTVFMSVAFVQGPSKQWYMVYARGAVPVLVRSPAQGQVACFSFNLDKQNEEHKPTGLTLAELLVPITKHFSDEAMMLELSSPIVEQTVLSPRSEEKVRAIVSTSVPNIEALESDRDALSFLENDDHPEEHREAFVDESDIKDPDGFNHFKKDAFILVHELKPGYHLTKMNEVVYLFYKHYALASLVETGNYVNCCDSCMIWNVKSTDFLVWDDLGFLLFDDDKVPAYNTLKSAVDKLQNIKEFNHHHICPSSPLIFNMTFEQITQHNASLKQRSATNKIHYLRGTKTHEERMKEWQQYKPKVKIAAKRIPRHQEVTSPVPPEVLDFSEIESTHSGSTIQELARDVEKWSLKNKDKK